MPKGFSLDVKIEDKDLKNVIKSLKSNLESRVGLIGAGATKIEGKATVAGIGALHEFGSPARNIPPRSFLRMPVELKSKVIARALVSKKALIEQALANGNEETIYKILGVAAEGVIEQAFQTGGFGQWSKLSPKTIQKKGSNKILIDTNQMRSSIVSKVSKKK